MDVEGDEREEEKEDVNGWAKHITHTRPQTKLTHEREASNNNNHTQPPLPQLLCSDKRKKPPTTGAISPLQTKVAQPANAVGQNNCNLA